MRSTVVDLRCYDEFETFVSMPETDAAGAVYATRPGDWAQMGMENLLRSVSRPLEGLVGRDLHYPVVNLTINHDARMGLGMHIRVRTWVSYVGNRSVKVRTEITPADAQSPAATCVRTLVARSRTGESVVAEGFWRELADGFAAVNGAGDGADKSAGAQRQDPEEREV